MNVFKAIGDLLHGIGIGAFVVTIFVMFLLVLLNIAVADESIAVRPATLGEQNRSLNYPLDPYADHIETIVIYVESDTTYDDDETAEPIEEEEEETSDDAERTDTTAGFGSRSGQ